MSTTVPIEHFADWLARGERGISSETIVSRLSGIPVGTYRWSSNYPHDPADFRRCELLLRWVPVARIGLPAMRGESMRELIDNAQQEVSPA